MKITSERKVTIPKLDKLRKNNQNYIINGGKQGSDRLKKLADATWENTRFYTLKAGLKKDLSVLDIGCGNGIITQYIQKIVGRLYETWAFDFDPKIIEIAKKLNERNDSINFFEFDISLNDLYLENKFDFIFCRYFLTHISNPDTVLVKLKKMLKPGGTLFLEDIDFKGHFCYPKNDAFDKYIKLYQDLCIIKQGNPYIGQQLFSMMKKNMFRDVKFFTTNDSFNIGPGKETALITFKAIYPLLLQNNLIDKKNGDKLITQLSEFTKQENSIISLPRIFHCYGVK